MVVSIQWALKEEPSLFWGPLGPTPNVPSLGSSSLCSGWIAALSTLKQDLAVSIIMMVAAGFFTLCAVLSLFLLKRVSGECWTNSKPEKEGISLPTPWGVHRFSSWASWVLKDPAAFSKVLGEGLDELGFLVGPQGGPLSPQPLSPGALPVSPDGGQLPAGPRGVFPGHLQQQDLSQCCFVCCPRSLPGELVLLTFLLPQPFLFTCLLNCTSHGCLKQCLCPA